MGFFHEHDLPAQRVAELAACAAVAVLLCLGWASDAAAAKAKGKSVVRAPVASKSYGARPIALRVRASRHDEVLAKLNGVPVGRGLDRRLGATKSKVHRRNQRLRRTTLSATNGLRHGRNVLRVRVRKFGGGVRRQKVRFRVTGRRPLAAAGRDQSLVPGAWVRLNGKRTRTHPSTRRGKLSYRWTVVKRPKRPKSVAGVAGTAGSTAGSVRGGRAKIRLRGTARPRFRAPSPGTYRVKVRVTAPGGRSATDVADLRVDPPPTLQLDTMARDAKGRWGIKLADTHYPADPQAWLQVLLVDRTLGTVISNTSYSCPNIHNNGWQACSAEVKSDLGALKSPANTIVIASAQPGADPADTNTSPRGVQDALQAIGVPSDHPPNNWPSDPVKGWPNGRGVLARGTYSALGVPKNPDGGTTWHVAQKNEPGDGEIKGLLLRNNELHYKFATPDRVTFDTWAEGSDSAESVIRVGDQRLEEECGGCDSDEGFFHVVITNPVTLKSESLRFTTGSKKGPAALSVMEQMRDALNRANDEGALVFISAWGETLLDRQAYDGLAVSHDLYRAIRDTATAIERLGGTRSGGNSRGGFYAAIDADFNNADPNGPRTYTLVGAANIGAGNGEEALASRDGEHPSLNQNPIGGTLTRSSSRYGFEVESTFNELPLGTHPGPPNPSQLLTDVVHQGPTPWPEDGNAGREAAIAWIGTQAGITDNPRGQYYTRPYDSRTWTTTQDLIKALQPSDLPARISAADFKWAQEQLVQEIEWLMQVHGYVAGLAAPYGATSLKSWADFSAIATKINDDVAAYSKEATTAFLTEIFDSVRGLTELLPEVGEAFEVANALYDAALATAEYAAGDGGVDGGDFETTVGRAGDDLASRLADAQQTLNDRFTNAIAADYGKLKTVAECSEGLPACPQKPSDWQVTNDDQTHIGAALVASFRTSAYATLLPAKYTWWRGAGATSDPNAHNLEGTGLAIELHPFLDSAGNGELAIMSCRDMNDHLRDEWLTTAIGYITGKGVVGDPYLMRVPGASVVDTIFNPINPADFLDSKKYFDTPLGQDREAFFRSYFPAPKTFRYPYQDSEEVKGPGYDRESACNAAD